MRFYGGLCNDFELCKIDRSKRVPVDWHHLVNFGVTPLTLAGRPLRQRPAKISGWPAIISRTVRRVVSLMLVWLGTLLIARRVGSRDILSIYVVKLLN